MAQLEGGGGWLKERPPLETQHTHHVPHEGGTCGGRVHTEESRQPASLVTGVVVHFQESVSLTWNRFNGNRESCQHDLRSSAAHGNR